MKVGIKRDDGKYLVKFLNKKGKEIKKLLTRAEIVKKMKK